MGGSRVAVVASAWQRVPAVQAGSNLRKYLVEPLQADVLLLLTYRWDDSCNSTSSCRLQEKLSGLWPSVTRLVLEPMVSMDELLYTLERLPHWSRILRAANLTRHPAQGARQRAPLYNTCVRDLSWSSSKDVGFSQQTSKPTVQIGRSPYKCDGLHSGGNTIFAPVIGPTRLNLLWQLHGLSRLRQLLRDQERDAGSRYDRVVVTRVDYHWL